MSWHYLQEQEAASWEGTSLDGAPDALLRLIPTHAEFFSHGSGTECCHGSQSGTTFEPSTGSRGGGSLMSSVPDSPARTSAAQALARALTENAPASGARWSELPVRFDRASSGWRTAHSLWDEGLPESSVTLPAWGCMHAGALWGRVMSERPICAAASGWLPTPTRTDANGRTYHYSRGDKEKATCSLVGMVKLLPTPCATDWKGRYTWETVKRRMQMSRGVRLPEELSRLCGKAITPNPEFWEWMMGWPIGSTGLQPLGMDRFLQWRQQHGEP